MVQLRFFTGSPGRLRVVAAGVALAAAGPALAAPSATETLESAIQRELDALRPDESPSAAAESEKATSPAAPRKLPEAQDSPIQKVSSEQPPVPPSAKPQPSAAQLEVMRQLEEMHKRDGREMPSMRIKDAPNTYLPKGQVVKPISNQSPSATAGTSPSTGLNGVPPAPSPAQKAAQKEPKRGFFSFFTKKETRSTQKKPSLFSRFKRPSTRKPASADDAGGLFGKLLNPFRPHREPAAMPHFVPTPPPLPEEYSPPSFVERSSPPQLLQPSNRSYAPETLPQVPPAPIAAAAPPAREREANPFAEVLENSVTASPRIVIQPARMHPLDSPFAAIEGETAPDLAFVATIDPEFADAEVVDAGIVDLDAPRTLEPEAVADTHDFAPPRVETAPTEQAKSSSAARYAELQRKLAERSGLGGFQGFCPVVLRDRRELVDSRPEFLSVYRGRTYELSSAETKARFEANPAKYAPVSGGNDVVLMSRGEVDAQGNLNHAVWFKDQLYLFRSSETVREFNGEPTKYAVTE